MQQWFSERVTERLLRYAVVDTQSDRSSTARPTTPGQWDLLKIISSELQDLGITDISVLDEGFLIARIPPTHRRFERVPPVGFMAHVDTSEDVSGRGVVPQVIKAYGGGDIPLGTSGYVLSPKEHPKLLACVGKDIITADGTTLLGADDKAGIAEIITAAEYLTTHPELDHGAVELIFTTDEETGRGMDHFPVEKLRSRYCYTLDGPGRGTMEAECFNALKCDVTFTGVSYHLGNARGRMVNAVTMAASFISMLPQAESPEATDGRFGYYCPLTVTGDAEQSSVTVFIRDFDRDEALRRAAAVEQMARSVQAAFPGGTARADTSWQYENMYDAISRDSRVLEVLKRAIAAAGITPEMTSIRGGTDGARLTAMGIPAPNIFSGGFNYHSRYEWACTEYMGEASQVVLETILHWAREG